MSTRTQMLCLWCGPAALLVFLVGFWFVAGLVPPPTPHDSAQEIQNLYQDDTDAIRIGLVLGMIGAGLTGPWVAAISTQMKRVEGEFTPLSYTQLGTGMLGVLILMLPMLVMQVDAFRPDRSPDTMLMINDLAWIPFIGIYPAAVIQNVSIGLCAFGDTEGRVFPRWIGYFNIWIALLFFGGTLIYFFKSGPFAWNGIFAFWLPLTLFALWIGVMFVILRRAIQAQAAESLA
jgi:hypothetical protein